MKSNNEHILRETPSRKQAAIFIVKSRLLQLKRGFENLTNSKTKRFTVSNTLKNATFSVESKTELWTQSNAAEEFMTAGKVHNLRVAIQKLNGIEIPANQIFSFWGQIGRANKRRGFVEGRELREGCIVPTIGGGLCQLSNALYDAALKANLEIVERHAHSQVIAGSLAEKNRDATIFWNYVDLRFRSTNKFRIEAELDANHLIVRFKSQESFAQYQKSSLPVVQIKNNHSTVSINNCASCGVESCFRSLKTHTTNFGRKAFLVDEFSPEFDSYLQENKRENDVLFVPLDGKRFKKPNYAWTTKGFRNIKQSVVTTFIRAYKSRKLAAQGAARQKNLLEMANQLSSSYSKQLTYDMTEICVHQNLLPFLWRSGALGGRQFDVLMTNLPLKYLQERLDFGFSRSPESSTLADFRAENWLVEAEIEALKNARKIITPHTEIATLFPDKCELLNWKMPKVSPTNDFVKSKSDKFTIVFPASTVGRKGIYELREALRGVDVRLVILGAEIEGKDFWRGFDVESTKENWLEKADLVVLPAFVEHKPRRLLQAVAHKIPVIASRACGVENVDGVTVIENGDVDSLRGEIVKSMRGNSLPSTRAQNLFAEV